MITKLHKNGKLYVNGKRFYSTYDTQYVTDTRLSHASKLILNYISAMSENWKWNDRNIFKTMKIGNKTFYKAKKELQNTGYLIMKKSYGHSYLDVDYDINLCPDLSIVSNDYVDNQLRGQLTTWSNDTVANDHTNNDKLIINKSNNDNLNNDNFNSNSTGILDKKSIANAQIFYSENFAEQNLPQPDNVIFEKAESEILMKELPYDPTAKLNEDEKLNESENNMKINNEDINENEMFVDATAINDSAQENIDSNNDSVHSEIDVITPNIEEDAADTGDTKDVIISTYGSGMYDICVELFGVKDIYTKDEVTKAFHISFDRF